MANIKREARKEFFERLEKLKEGDRELDYDFDRKNLNSKMFRVKNFSSSYVELETTNHKIVDKIFVYSNSVVFYSKNSRTPIDEFKNISLDNNEELTKFIEQRLKSIKREKGLRMESLQDRISNLKEAKKMDLGQGSVLTKKGIRALKKFDKIAKVVDLEDYEDLPMSRLQFDYYRQTGKDIMKIINNTESLKEKLKEGDTSLKTYIDNLVDDFKDYTSLVKGVRNSKDLEKLYKDIKKDMDLNLNQLKTYPISESLKEDNTMSNSGAVTTKKMLKEQSFKVGDIVVVGKGTPNEKKGKVEKTNPLKIRTDPTSTMVVHPSMSVELAESFSAVDKNGI